MPQRPYPGPVEVARSSSKKAANAHRSAVVRRRRRKYFLHDFASLTVIRMAAGGDRFSAYMRARLDDHRWKVAELARRAGLTRQTVSEWLNKGVPPDMSAENILKIAKAFGDDPAEVYRIWAGLPPASAPDVELILTALSDPDGMLIATSALSVEEKARLLRRFYAVRPSPPEPPADEQEGLADVG